MKLFYTLVVLGVDKCVFCIIFDQVIQRRLLKEPYTRKAKKSDEPHW